MGPLLIPIAMELAKFAPGIIKLLTGSDKAADVANAVVGVAQAVTGTSTPQEALTAIQADPQKILDFQIAIGAQQIDMEKAYLSGVEGARNRDVELAKVGQPNYRANILAAGAVLLVIFCLMVTVWGSDMDDFAKATITLICGRALGWVEQVFSFEFGSTRNNQKKDDTINNLTK